MFSLTIKSIRANKARFVLTAVAVMLGVAFMAGTLVLTDTIKQSYDNLAGHVYEDTDAVVRSASTRRGPMARRLAAPSTRSCSTRSATSPASQAAEPQLLGVALVVGHDGELLDAAATVRSRSASAWQNDSRSSTRCDLVDGTRPGRRRRDRHRPRVGRQGRLRSRRHHPGARPGRFGGVPARRHRDLRRRGRRGRRPGRRVQRRDGGQTCSARPVATTPSRSSPRPACRRTSSSPDLQTAIADPTTSR